MEKDEKGKKCMNKIRYVYILMALKKSENFNLSIKKLQAIETKKEKERF